MVHTEVGIDKTVDPQTKNAHAKMLNVAWTVWNADKVDGYIKLGEGTVDGERWFIVHVKPEVLYWLKSLNSPNVWQMNESNTHWKLIVDMTEAMFTMMELRWA